MPLNQTTKAIQNNYHMTDEQQLRLAGTVFGVTILHAIIQSILQRLRKRTPYEWGKLLGARTKRLYKLWALRK